MLLRSLRRKGGVLLLLFCLSISLSLGGCSPEQKALLKVTALEFKNQATAAIEAVQQLYQLREPERSPEEARSLLLDRLLQSKLNVADVRQVDRLITRSTNQLPPRSTQVDNALADLKAEYEAASAVFNDLDQLDFASPGLVTQAAKPARNLTVKLLLLAKLISQSPPTPGDPSRVAISVRIDQLRRKYASGNLSDFERQSIRNQLNQQVDQWTKISTDERRRVCDAIAKLVKAVETGQKLSTLADNYSQRRLSDILEEIVRILGAASNLTGGNYIGITSRLQVVDDTINNDPTLRSLIQDILNRSSGNSWSLTNSSDSTSDLLQCQS